MSISARYRMTRVGLPTGIIYVNRKRIIFGETPPQPLPFERKEVINAIANASLSIEERLANLQQWLKDNTNG